MHLKENIIERFDFEVVSPEVWKHLYSWYSADWCIMRYIKRDKVNKQVMVLDLYPDKRNTELEDEEQDDGEDNEESEMVV